MKLIVLLLLILGMNTNFAWCEETSTNKTSTPAQTLPVSVTPSPSPVVTAQASPAPAPSPALILETVPVAPTPAATAPKENSESSNSVPPVTVVSSGLNVVTPEAQKKALSQEDYSAKISKLIQDLKIEIQRLTQNSNEMEKDLQEIAPMDSNANAIGSENQNDGEKKNKDENLLSSNKGLKLGSFEIISPKEKTKETKAQ